MKKMLLLTALFALTVLATAVAQAAPGSANADAGVSAIIMTPLTIIKTVDLDFGKVASGTAAGTVTVDTLGARTKAGDVTLIAAGSNHKAASFDVSGEPNATYTVQLPSSITITKSAGVSMTVSTFTSNPGASGVLSAAGGQTIKVGATLAVVGSQAAGTYTGSFTVTVAYN